MRTDIQIVYHLGAPYTDNEQVTWSLRKDAPLLSEKGIFLRRPRKYRAHVTEMVKELQGEKPSVVDQENLLNSIIGNEQINRLIMSNSGFLGVPAWMFYGSAFYKNAAKNTVAIRNLFPDNPCEFFLGVANPAVFIPAAFKAQKEKDYAQFMDNTDLAQVRWSDVISRIQQANPDCPLTVWANEDTPIVWPDVLRGIAGLEPDIRLNGELDILREIISEEGFAALEKYLADRPEMTDKKRKQTWAAFLEKYYLQEAVDETIDMPGWLAETVEALTEIYEHDLEVIKTLPGVKFLS